MSVEAGQCIPSSMNRWLAEVPVDRPVALLLRHSVREDLPTGDVGNALPINDEGVRLGREFGRLMKGRLRTLHSSPLVRCIQTAEVLLEGADASLPVIADHLLGDPGVYVVDAGRAWNNWESLGHEGVVARLVSGNETLPGMANPELAAHTLVHHMLAVAKTSGLHVFVTHDSLVTATAARLLRKPIGKDAWPLYLEGAFFWRDDDDGIHAAYRDWSEGCKSPAFCIE